MVSAFTLYLSVQLLLNSAAALPLPKRDLFLLLPHLDSFYSDPGNLDSLQNGEIYNQRQIFPEVEYAGAQSVHQIAYRTTDLFGKPSHTVATVFTPWLASSEPKLFSYQIWEDAVNIDCSPSYSVYAGALAPDGLTSTLDTAIFIEWALSKGYHAVLSDHEGPKSTFFEGLNEGYAVLDGIRAAESYLGWNSDTPVALYGYSGGGHATVWSTDLAGAYAPELNIIAAAHGGTPIDTKETMEFLDGQTFSGFVLGALAGLLKAYDGTPAAESLRAKANAKLQTDLSTITADDTCIITELLDYADTEFHEMFSYSDFYTESVLEPVFAAESLLKNVSSHNVSTPTYPRYIFHAVQDEIIPNYVVQQYVSQQCEAGANIQYVQFPGGDHIGVEYTGIPGAMQFIQEAFEGKTAKVTCGTAPQDILTLTTEGVGSIIGQAIVDAINALAGLVTPLGTIRL